MTLPIPIDEVASGGRTRRAALDRTRLVARVKLGVGVSAYLLLWELAGRRQWFGRTFPALSAVIDTIVEPTQRPVLQRALGATARAAGTGFGIGVVGAALGAVVALLVPVLRPGINQLATIAHAAPIIALAPLFIVTLGRERTPMAIAAIAASFAMFVAATAAVDTATPEQHDLFTALGSTALRRFRALELPAAIPGLADGLRLAAPAAVLGAVIGEWFGAPRGLGLLIVSAMQNFQVQLLWAAALLAAAVSMVAYGTFSLVAVWAARRWAVSP